MRLIDADTLMDDVMERYCKDCDKRKGIKSGKWRIVYEIGDAPCRACSVDDMKDELENAPTVEPKTMQWIPCSKRMPEDLEEVNVTWVNHDPEPYYNFVKDKPFTGSAVYYKEKWYWYSSKCADILCEYGENDIDEVDDAIEIIAWMPLPEPYREDGEADGDG